jgi:hypothetical protein
MGCIGCGPAAVSERWERTAQSYRRFRCRAYDELRNFLRSRSRTNQQVSADYRRFGIVASRSRGHVKGLSLNNRFNHRAFAV